MRYLKPVFLLAFSALLLVGWGNKEAKLTEGIQPGNLAPGFNRQELNVDGKKWVLLQFWAVYDGKSRIQNVRMYNAVKNLRTDKIQFVSVSLDENQSVFEGAVKTDQLASETQFNEPKGKKSEWYRNYRLKSGFNNWLINEEGIIIAKNVSPEEIPDYL